MNTKIMIKMIGLEWLRTKNMLIGIIAIYALLISLQFLPLIENEHYYITYALMALIYSMLPFIAGLLLSSGIISEDIQNNTMDQLLALPVKRSMIWMIRHLTRAFLFSVILIIYLTTYPIVIQTLRHSLLILNIRDYALLSTLAACFLFSFGSVFSNLMENTFSSVLGGFTGGIVMLFLFRSIKLSNVHMDKLLIIATVYFPVMFL